VLLGPIISRLFTCSNEEKEGACSSPISIVNIKTTVEVTNSDKHSRLLRHGVNHGRKMFHSTVLGCKKTSFLLLYLVTHEYKLERISKSRLTFAFVKIIFVSLLTCPFNQRYGLGNVE
jgi:hypothetical protein